MCFDLIQIIFRELICSLLKLLILKFVKNVKVNVVMRRCVPDCSPAHIYIRGLEL